MGTTYVGTEHLLLGLLVEGEGIAAHVLDDLGATWTRCGGRSQSLAAIGIPGGARERRRDGRSARG